MFWRSPKSKFQKKLFLQIFFYIFINFDISSFDCKNFVFVFYFLLAFYFLLVITADASFSKVLRILIKF